MSRWALVPLAIVAIASLGAAVGVDVGTGRGRPADSSPAPGGPAALAAPVTPVLSVRRVPELIAAPVADRRLRTALEGLMTGVGGTACLTVSAGGGMAYAHNPTELLVPASVQKLMTGVVALELLGPEHRLRTTVGVAGSPEAGLINGDLWLIGGGDPLLATDAYIARFENQPQIHTDVEALADAVVRAGVREIRGSVMGDGSRYDDQRYVAGWAERFIRDDESGPLSALSANDGFIRFPPSHTVSQPDEEPAVDPAAHAAEVFSQLLASRGVVVAGPPASGRAPGDLTDIARVDSPPLVEVVTQMLRESDNRTAELLTKELGLRHRGAGTTAAGVAVIRDKAAELGLPVGGTVTVDGSGLAEGNRSTCELAQAILGRNGPGSTLASMLAVAGETGTLARRYAGTDVVGRLRAKTGTLRTVTALAGYLATVPGADVTFAFIENVPTYQRVGQQQVRFQDELLAILLRYPEGPDLGLLGPTGPADR